MVDFGIGVSACAVFAGNIGAENRYEYTVVGDVVNEAARLADTAKAVWTNQWRSANPGPSHTITIARPSARPTPNRDDDTETTCRNPQKDNFNAKNDNFIETGQ